MNGDDTSKDMVYKGTIPYRAFLNARVNSKTNTGHAGTMGELSEAVKVETPCSD